MVSGELPRWTAPRSKPLSKPRVNNSLLNEKTVLEGSGKDQRECKLPAAPLAPLRGILFMVNHAIIFVFDAGANMLRAHGLR
jgi:hypothetical protein